MTNTVLADYINDLSFNEVNTLNSDINDNHVALIGASDGQDSGVTLSDISDAINELSSEDLDSVNDLLLNRLLAKHPC